MIAFSSSEAGGERRRVGSWTWTWTWTHFIWVKEGDRDRQLARELEGEVLDIRHHDEFENREKWWSRTKRRNGMLGWYRNIRRLG